MSRTRTNLVGQQFGDWLVLEDIGNKYGNRHYYLCQNIRTNELRERRSDKIQGNLGTKIVNTDNYKELEGIKNGKLKVIKILNESNKNWNRYLQYECDCGNTGKMLITNFLNHNIISCGCIVSKGEEKIISLLKNNNFNYETQKTFETCRFINTNALARFDFYIKNKYLVEYDGIQHFFGGWNKSLKENQEKDIFKNQWCKENNIPLIRIPYTRYDDLCIEDLLLETSEYVVSS